MSSPAFNEAKIEYGVETDVLTLQRFVLKEQRKHPEAHGDLTLLITSLITAIKAIASATQRAGLANLYGMVGTTNVQGEKVKKLDVISNEIMINMLRSSYSACMLISEECENIVVISENHRGKYIVAFDPLDGSSNVDYLIPTGTIFSIYKKADNDVPKVTDALQSGRHIVAAGYAMYGSATIVVMSMGQGVNGFTLDPNIGEFILTHKNIKLKEKGSVYSVNEGYFNKFSKGVQEYLKAKKGDEIGKGCCSHRYVGSMVADMHRTLLKSGLFLYPPTASSPNGKLRLLYECNPMSFLVEQAGGKAWTGKGPTLDVVPTDIHQRSPLIIGSRADVDEVLSFMQKHDS